MYNVSMSIKWIINLAVISLGAVLINSPAVLAAPTSLSPNDIVVVTANLDTSYSPSACVSNPESNGFDLLLRKDIAVGTEIKVTDNAWNGSALLNTEGRVVFVADHDMYAGEIIRYSDCIVQDPTNGWTRVSNFDQAVNGDNLLIYQGDESTPNFIYGFGYRSNSWISSGATTANNSYLPSSLASVTPVAYNTMGSSTARNYQYIPGTVQGIFSDDFLSDVRDFTNWQHTGGPSAGTPYPLTSVVFDGSRPYFNAATRMNPLQQLTTSGSVSFNITTSEDVQDLASNSFSIATTGSITYSSVDTVKISAYEYRVDVSGIEGMGDLSLQSFTGTSLLNVNGNPALDTSFTSQSYSINRTIPEIIIQNMIDGADVKLTGSLGSSFTCYSALRQSDLAVQDNTYVYPLGFVDFCLSVIDGTNEVSILFETDLSPADVVVRKYSILSNSYSTIVGATVTDAYINSRHALEVRYQIVDNGSLDDDLVAGVIRDPVGLGVIPSSDSPSHGDSGLPLVPSTGASSVSISAGHIAQPIIGVALILLATYFIRKEYSA